MLLWCHNACTLFFVKGKLIDESVLPVTEKESKGRGNEAIAQGWKWKQMLYLSPLTKNKVHASRRQASIILQGVLVKKKPEHTTWILSNELLTFNFDLIKNISLKSFLKWWLDKNFEMSDHFKTYFSHLFTKMHLLNQIKTKKLFEMKVKSY